MTSSPDGQPWLKAWTRLVIRHASVILLLALSAGVFGVWRTGHLHIDPDLKALIPADFPSIVRLNELSKRIGSQSEYIVELRCPERDECIRYGTALTEAMEKHEELFRYVEFQRDVEWFSDHALLFLPFDQLLNLRARIVHRIRDEVEAAVVEDFDGPAAAQNDATDTEEEDPLELNEAELRARYGQEYDIPTEYIEIEDIDGSTILVVRGYPNVGTTDVDFTNQLTTQMQETLTRVHEGFPDTEITATVRGGYQARSGEVSSMKSSVLGSILYTVGLLLLVLIGHFKRFRAALFTLLPLVLSILLTLGISTIIFDSLNLVTAFTFAILIGLGIDFGLHWLSRYEYERLRGASQSEALITTGGLTGKDIAVGALSTALMFSFFPIADFQGFAQFGILACIGVLNALLFTLTVIPALIVVTERIAPWSPRRWLPMVSGPEPKTQTNSSFQRTRWRPIALMTIALSVGLAGWSAFQAPEIEFEYDFGKLGPRPKDNAGPSGPQHKDFEDAIGRPNFGPALAMAPDAETGRRVDEVLRGVRMLTDRQMERLLISEGLEQPGFELSEQERKNNNPDPNDKPPPIDQADEEDIDEDDPFAVPEADPFADLQARIDREELSRQSQLVVDTYDLTRLRSMRYYLWSHLSLWTFVPSDQEQKLAIIADVRRRIDAKYDDMGEDAQEKVGELRRYLAVDTPVGPEDVPEWLRNRWTDSSGIAGRHAILWNRGAKADYIEVKALEAAWFNIRLGPDDDTLVPVGGNYFILAEIIDTLRRDGPRVIVASLSAILFCLLLMFRSLRLTLLILVPLVASITWLAGVFWLLDWKLNLFNVITFALLIGMGVDDGVHMVSRWLESGQRSVAVAVRETGPAISLTTVTTCIGFSGLFYANHIGLGTLGWTAGVGMVLCLLASVTTLPALLYLLGRSK